MRPETVCRRDFASLAANFFSAALQRICILVGFVIGLFFIGQDFTTPDFICQGRAESRQAIAWRLLDGI